VSDQIGRQRVLAAKTQQRSGFLNSKIAYVLAAVAVIAVMGAYFLGLMSGTKSSTAPSTPPAPAVDAAQAPTPTPARTAPAPVQGQPQWVTVATDGSWEVRCQSPAPATGSACTAVLQIVEKKSGNVLFAWIVGAPAKNGPVTTFETPTGVLIPSGIEVKLGESPARRVNYTACMPQHCSGDMPMDEGIVKQMSAGGKASVAIVAADGRGVEFSMSLAGFEKAFAAISK
jgi:invasion protein IalB